MTSRYPGGLIRKNAANTAVTGASGVWDLGSQAQAVKNNTWPISGLALPVSGSLRFRSSASAYLDRTPASSGSLTTWTFSTWIKLGSISTSQTILAAGLISGTIYYNRISVGSDGSIGFFNYPDAGPNGGWLFTANLLRDPSAWYHLVFVWNTTSATSSDRMQIYINGTRVTNFVTNTFAPTFPAQNTQSLINSSSYSHRIGRTESGQAGGNFLDSYLAETYYIDGQALTPASFGQTSPITGVWEPIKYTGTYGTNGFYLSLSDTSSIGKDFSGNGNNWTPNNISTTNDSTFDLMRDVPNQWAPQGVTDVGGTVRGNYWTLNPLNPGQLGTPQSGNLEWIAGDQNNFRTIAAPVLPTSGKFYWEVQPIGGGGGGAFVSGIYIGIMNYANGGTGLFASAARLADTGKDDYIYYNDGRKVNLNSFVSYGNSYVANDIIGIAVDIDNSKIWFSKNGTWQASGDPAAGTNAAYTTVPFSTKPFAPAMSAAEITNAQKFNFGQRPFAYTPPSGFKSLCTTNLPTPTIGATTTTAANKYFDATLYTGNGANNRTISSNLTPDLVWMKDRTNAYSHILIDSIRGTGRYLRTNGTSNENWDGNIFPNSRPTTNGFIVDGGLNVSINANGDSYVAWQWNAGGANTTNTSGSITSIVRANQTAGFSIVTYTGSGAAGTVGHGLGTAPAMIITKNRTTDGQAWPTWHKGMSSAYSSTTSFIYLDQTAAAGTTTNFYDGTAMTSSTFRWQTGNINVNSTSNDYVSYVFAEIAGYSAFGSYTGNGSTDGPFVYTGFRPKFVMVKRTDSSDDWIVIDSTRSPYNVAILTLYANGGYAEDSNVTNRAEDFLSNGFKIRSAGIYLNASGGTYIYMAFAEFPFKNSLAR